MKNIEMNSPEVSIVVPFFNEELMADLAIRKIIEVMINVDRTYEIIAVDDGSTDTTVDILRDLKNEFDTLRLICFYRNWGHMAALSEGLMRAKGQIVISLDGDLQDPPEIIPAFFEKWREDGFDVVYGRRVRREATRFMRLAYKAFYRIFRGLADINIPLDAGDFSLIDRRVVEQMLNLPETDQFLRGLRAWVGFKQTGVDYHRPERMFGVSTNNLRKNLKWARKGIFSFSYAPLEFLLLGGVALMGLAGVALVINLGVWLLDPEVPRGLTTLVSLILGFGGLQLFATAIVGEYVGKILDEAKARPKLIVRAITHRGIRLDTSSDIQDFVDERELARGR
jgi:dolichol-phosphate mannosyltransferase